MAIFSESRESSRAEYYNSIKPVSDRKLGEAFIALDIPELIFQRNALMYAESSTAITAPPTDGQYTEDNNADLSAFHVRSLRGRSGGKSVQVTLSSWRR